MGEKVYDEVRIFTGNNGNVRDVYIKSELSIGDKFITVKTNSITVIYPTCNVTKIVLGKSNK